MNTRAACLFNLVKNIIIKSQKWVFMIKTVKLKNIANNYIITKMELVALLNKKSMDKSVLSFNIK
jgi:hypothetical protein